MESLSPDTSARALRAAVASQPLWIETSGSSMGTAIETGAEVRLVVASRPRRGEIWAYIDDEGRLVVHRFIGRRHGLLVFRGDALRSTDRLVAEERLVGKVAARRDGVGVHLVSRGRGLLWIGRWKIEGALRRLIRRFRAGA